MESSVVSARAMSKGIPEHSARVEGAVSLRRSLGPLIGLLGDFDRKLERLSREISTMKDLEAITAALTQPKEIVGRSRTHSVCLVSPESVEGFLGDVGSGNLHLIRRQDPMGFPAFYLFRTMTDSFGEYRLIVEDYHVSPGFAFMDERFERTGGCGGEEPCLRLSPMRKAASIVAGRSGAVLPEFRTDSLLYSAGRLVLRSAWHEDQRIAFQCSGSFSARCFRNTLEMLYLCLSGDLPEVRDSGNPDLHEFFRSVYGQPLILDLFSTLPGMGGDEIDRLRHIAVSHYRDLAEAFGEFLRTPVPWGTEGTPTELAKVVFSHFRRLDLVVCELGRCRELAEAVEKLENRSREISRRVLG